MSRGPDRVSLLSLRGVANSKGGRLLRPVELAQCCETWVLERYSDQVAEGTLRNRDREPAASGSNCVREQFRGNPPWLFSSTLRPSEVYVKGHSRFRLLPSTACSLQQGRTCQEGTLLNAVSNLARGLLGPTDWEAVVCPPPGGERS